MINVSLLIRFALVGGSTALIYLGLTFLLVETLALNATGASTIALVTAALYNYLLHYQWTFATDAPHGRVLFRYLVMCTGVLILNALVMHFGVSFTNTHYMLIQLVAAGVVICWNLVVSSLWVFRKR